MVNRVKKMGRVTGAISDASRTLLGRNISRALSGAGVRKLDAYASPNPIPGFKNGGKVKRTGLARVHKGEVVLTASAAKQLTKILKR